MSEAAANSKEKNEIEVSKTILPENKKYESESFNYQINIPDWLLKDIDNFEKSNMDSNIKYSSELTLIVIKEENPIYSLNP